MSPSLFAFSPAPRESPAKNRRSPARRCDYLYVRQVRTPHGRWLFQARAWLPLPLGSIHLGLYDTERAAWGVVRAWIKAGADPVHGLPDGVLPKWVRRLRDGTFLAVRRDRRGERLPLGVFPTAEAAHAAARDWTGRPSPPAQTDATPQAAPSAVVCRVTSFRFAPLFAI